MRFSLAETTVKVKRSALKAASMAAKYFISLDSDGGTNLMPLFRASSINSGDMKFERESTKLDRYSVSKPSGSSFHSSINSSLGRMVFINQEGALNTS